MARPIRFVFEEFTDDGTQLITRTLVETITVRLQGHAVNACETYVTAEELIAYHRRDSLEQYHASLERDQTIRVRLAGGEHSGAIAPGNPNLVSRPDQKFSNCQKSNKDDWDGLAMAWERGKIPIEQQRKWIAEFVETVPFINRNGFMEQWAGNETECWLMELDDEEA